MLFGTQTNLLQLLVNNSYVHNHGPCDPCIIYEYEYHFLSVNVNTVNTVDVVDPLNKSPETTPARPLFLFAAHYSPRIGVVASRWRLMTGGWHLKQRGGAGLKKGRRGSCRTGEYEAPAHMGMMGWRALGQVYASLHTKDERARMTAFDPFLINKFFVWTTWSCRFGVGGKTANTSRWAVNYSVFGVIGPGAVGLCPSSDFQFSLPCRSRVLVIQ
ncbi:hypothetical protein B0I37DRAFT_83955 [Chaetomium sp. MPI-CAGE-AT-0009]|nr:hypothetical protein B0I37DRAFT_83955 [Chaetomium sp. MPI-CAGE-AT-0009]